MPRPASRASPARTRVRRSRSTRIEPSMKSGSSSTRPPRHLREPLRDKGDNRVGRDNLGSQDYLGNRDYLGNPDYQGSPVGQASLDYQEYQASRPKAESSPP